MMKKKREIARDFLGLGSWVFYVLVIARALIEPYRPFLDQVIIAGIFILVTSFIWKNFDDYVARTLVLVVFTSLFYKSAIYLTFAIIIGALLLISSYYLNKKIFSIINGLIVGIVSSVLGFTISNFTF